MLAQSETLGNNGTVAISRPEGAIHTEYMRHSVGMQICCVDSLPQDCILGYDESPFQGGKRKNFGCSHSQGCALGEDE